MFNLQHITLAHIFLEQQSAAASSKGLWATSRRTRSRHAGRAVSLGG